MTRAIVVGGGLFGSIIAAELRHQGAETEVIDSREPGAGSRPAACLIKPNWIAGLGREVTEPALELLDRHYGVHDLEFVAGTKFLRSKVHWVDPAQVLQEPDRVAWVTNVGDGWVTFFSTDHWCDITLEADLVVVAAGVWSKQLVDLPGLSGRSGVAFLWPQARIKQPFIYPWAPYKQVVAFNRGDGLWCGDGRSIKAANWSDDHMTESLGRCARYTQQNPANAHTLWGIRPYMPNAKAGHVRQLSTRTWVATGGAKNGTVAAAHAAHVIGRNA